MNNDIAINVFVSALDDFEVSVPNNLLYNSSYRPGAVVPQGGDVAGDDTNTAEEANAPTTTRSKECVGEAIVVDHTNDVFFGETIVSIRQLMKRYSLVLANLLTSGAATTALVTEPDFPPYRAVGIGRHNTTGSVAANIVNTTPLTWFTPCYVGRRGSLRAKYVFKGALNTTNPYDVFIERNSNTGSSLTNYIESGVTPTSTNISTFASTTFRLSGMNGGDYTNCNLQPVLEVEFPFYSNTRFAGNRDFAKTVNGYGGHGHNMYVNVPASGTFYDRYASVGEDYTLFWWQGQPPFAKTV